MSKVRIVESGWENYTGMLGTVEFKEGVSTEPLSRMEAGRLAGILRMENVDDGHNPSVSQQILDSQAHMMANATLPTAEELENASADAAKAEEGPMTYTKEQLEAIADKGGIKALRVIGDKLGVRGNSIAGLIDEILAVLASNKEYVPPVETPAPEAAPMPEAAPAADTPAPAPAPEVPADQPSEAAAG